MERKLLVAETIELLDDQSSQNLLAAHTLPAGLCATGPADDILVHPGERPGDGIQDRTDLAPFSGVDVIDSTGDKGTLAVYFLSHRSAVPSGVLGGTPRKHSLQYFYFHPRSQKHPCFQQDFVSR